MAHKMIPTEVDALLLALKARLRERRLTYANVASALEVSVPTVKRTLNGSDIALSRLVRIARLAGATLEELIDEAGIAGRPVTYFTEEQDALFARHPHINGYVNLLAEGKTPHEIARAYDLRTETTRRYLSLLRKVGLVQISASGVASLTVRAPFGFSRKSVFLKTRSARVLEEFLAHLVEKFDRPEHDMILLKPMRLGSDAHEQMKTELKAIIERYSVLSDAASKKGRPLGVETFTVVLSDRWRMPRPLPTNF